MAGNPQGGGAPRPNTGNAAPAMQNWQNIQQNMRQNMSGMPSQYPGANVAAPGGGMASAAVMPQAQGNGEQMRFMQPPPVQTMPMAPQGQNVEASVPAWQWQNVQGQQDQNLASAAVMPQAPQVSQVMPMAPQGQGQQTAMPMDARILPNGATVGRDDPRFYQGQNAGPAGVSPNWQRLQNMAAQYGQQGQANPNDWRTGAAAAHQAEIMKSQLGAPQQDPRMQQNPRMTPRVSDMMPRRENLARPQIQGNPNSIPMQRGQGRVR